MLALGSIPALAQNTPSLPPVQLAPDDDGPVAPVAPNAAPQVQAAPGWTFEEVMGGDVTVGEPVSPTAMAVGALAGVAVFNVVAQYVFPNANLLTQTAVAETDLAASRIYAVGSAVAGALAGQYVYEQTNDDN
jgi:hypothetical protein